MARYKARFTPSSDGLPMASDALLIGLVSLDRRAIGSGLEGMPVQAHDPEWRPGAAALAFPALAFPALACPALAFPALAWPFSPLSPEIQPALRPRSTVSAVEVISESLTGGRSYPSRSLAAGHIRVALWRQVISESLTGGRWAMQGQVGDALSSSFPLFHSCSLSRLRQVGDAAGREGKGHGLPREVCV